MKGTVYATQCHSIYEKTEIYVVAMAATPNISSLLFDNTAFADNNESYIGSVSVRLANEQRSRGLFATKDIKMGDCLFLLPPILSVSTADVKSSVSETAAENALIQAMINETDEGRLRAFQLLLADPVRDEAVLCETTKNSSSLLLQLVGKNKSPFLSENEKEFYQHLTDSHCRLMIRRNAFGPDFVTYDDIAKHHSALSSSSYRLLGLYPLAAMINHSCISPNAVRVYKNDWMVVHASQDIKKGDEIVWSYVPLCQPYPERTKSISSFSFTCTCERCQQEEIWLKEQKEQQLKEPILQQILEDRVIVDAATIIQTVVQRLEEFIPLSTKGRPSLQTWLRLGWVIRWYLPYFNSGQASEDALLRLGLQLHLSFRASNRACTEHLSVRIYVRS